MNLRIKQLPPLIANQIAAGEVIERPASVVKELLENAQDAGAKNITIELSFAGFNLIKISDDGHGIYQEDLPLAIMAHATSKIYNLEDLYSVQSMGFRGEALASIASIAKLVIISRPASQKHAAKLEIQADKILISPCARAIGTTIEVWDLFYNAPVRKNFLKCQRTELQYIEDIVKRFALAVSNITINVKHNSKEILNIPAGLCADSNLLRVKKILGAKFVNSAIPVNCNNMGIQLSGLLGHPSYQRSQKDKQWIYLNKRMLRDKLLQHAIMQTYQAYMAPGRYPTCLLYLNMQTDLVDVNVHPTKHEVRFKKPRDIHDFLLASLSTCVRDSEFKLNMSDAPQDTERPAFKPKITPNNTPKLNKILILNNQFAIYYQKNEPYLLNLANAYKDYYHVILKNSAYPLPNRPLLVPINYAIDKVKYEYFMSSRALLCDFGVTFDFFDTHKLIIRTIPQCLPQLDIKLLLTNIDFKKTLNKLELMNLLIDCQEFYAQSSSEQELITLIEHIDTYNLWTKHARHLSMKVCKDILENV